MVQSGGKNIELAVMRRDQPLKVSLIFGGRVQIEGSAPTLHTQSEVPGVYKHTDY